MPYLGLEIGGTKLQLGLGGGDGTITRLVRLQVDPPRGAEGIRAQIVEAFREMNTEVSAIGIGFGGPVDGNRGVVTKSNQIEGWDGFPLVDWVRSTLGVENVTLQNDADTAALGEARFGAGKGLSPVLYVNSGSGIGGGLIVDGTIYRGSGVGAIEIGHLWIAAAACDGSLAEHGRLEDLASGWGIARAGRGIVANADKGYEQSYLTHLCDGDPAKVTAAMVAQAVRNRCIQSGLVLDKATTAMGIALAHAVTLLAPRLVILGGGVSLIDEDLWLEPIRRALDERVFPPFRGTFDIVTAALGEDVVVHGALALARDTRPQ
ncbi:MAG: transcriptional regulator/sugar kinase [Planctomycetota bacterium]|nr:transcriptional regulator/sugar kinase [Planctomycetota bacterium]